MATSKSSYFFSSLQPISIMDRYLICQLLPPFLFGVGAFTSVILAIDSLFELLRKVVESGLPLSIAAEVFLLKLPYVLVYSFPMSTLLATLMTYSRLSSQSELIALRSCGVSIYRMVTTAVVLSSLVTGMTFLFNEQIVPAANYRASTTLSRALKSEQPSFRKENIIVPEYRKVKLEDGSKEKLLLRMFYADKFDGKQMSGLTVIDRSKDGLNQIIVANSGQWNPVKNLWDFYNGSIYLVAPDRSYRNIIKFEHQQVKLPRTALDVAQKSKDYGEMNIAQALEQLEIERLGGDEKKIQKLKVRIQQKVAFPFVCIVFGLVGSAMGTIPQRSGKGTSFGISVIVIFSYYLLLSVCGALAQAGILSPFMGAWMPNFFGFGIGVFLLLRVAKK